MADTSVNITKITAGNRLVSATKTWAEVSADHTVTDEDVVIVTSTAAARAITLRLLTAAPLGKTVTIVDGSGAAGTNNITVTAAGSNTINGAATIVISANYGTVTLYPTVADGWVTTVHEEAGSGGGSGANALGTYLVQTATNKPTNAQVLASLATGIVKNTTTTGALSIATSADYVAPGTAASFIAPSTIDGTGVNSVPLLVKTGKNLTGVEVQGTGSSPPAYLIRNAAGTQKTALGVAVGSNDFTFNTLADDTALVAVGALWLAGSTVFGVKIHNATGNAIGTWNDNIGAQIGWSGALLTLNGSGATFQHPANSSQQVTFTGGNNIATSADSPYLKATSTFAPTSGTATYELFSAAYTINQTGGANGACRGIKLAATETAVGSGGHAFIECLGGASAATTIFKVDNTGLITSGLAMVALGGGAAPTVGTIGGSGPASAGQSGWMKVNIAGTDKFIPVWA